MPDLHGWHTSLLCAPTVVEYVPTVQDVHEPAPELDHVPALQFTQLACDAAWIAPDDVPALHGVHPDDTVAATTLDHEPAPHLLHWLPEVAPVAADHEPAAH